jgi:cytochrome P450
MARPLASAQSWIKQQIARRALASIDMVPLRRDRLDPVAELGERRRQEPISKLTRVLGTNVWLVAGYEEVRGVLADHVAFSNDIRPLVGKTKATGPGAIGGLGSTDAPDHTKLRRLLIPEFTMRRLRELDPRITQIVEEQLDVVEAAGPGADLVETFAFPIPFRVICELLGLPEGDRERFREIGHARFDASAGVGGLFGAMSDSREFLIDAVARQRRAPGDGLIGSLLVRHGDDLTDVELGGLADGVFTGGFETSASMLALGAVTLLQHPEAYAQLRDDSESVDPIIDELLRYLTVVQVGFPRIARDDMTLYGAAILKGDVVLCSLSGANRDQTFGEDADAFNPSRSPHSHLAFGHGLHRCVGSELGRMELRIALRTLSRRFPDLALAVDPSDLTFHDLSIVHGIGSLPVTAAARCPVAH